MLQTDILHSGHADLVTDLCYDFYGERLATGSADQKIKIWRKDTRSSSSNGGNDRDRHAAKQNWENEAEWKAHEAPILKLSWAHPEFGSVLASCSYDRSVRIWEEVGGHSVAVGASTDGNGHGNGNGNGNGIGNEAGSGGKKRWVERALMNEARGSVRAVEFGHNAFGLKLASISTDSHLRIYTSLSPSLNDWHLSHSLHIPSLQSLHQDYNYNHNQHDGFTTPQMGGHAVPTGNVTTGFSGLNSTTTGGLMPTGSAASASALAQSTHTNLTTTSSLNTGTGSSGSGSRSGSGTAGGSAAGGGLLSGKGADVLGGWAVSWCKEKWAGEVMAVTAGHLGVIKIVSLSTPQPSAVLTLSPPSTPLIPPSSTFPGLTPNPTSDPSGSRTPQPHPIPYPTGAQAITSLSWAPSCGKAYYLIASGHRDGTVRIWRVVVGEEGRWSGSVLEEWGRGEATIGRVEWNITGSILSVASEDGKIRLYKATYAGKWDCMGTFSAEAPSDEGDEEGEGDEGMQE